MTEVEATLNGRDSLGDLHPVGVVDDTWQLAADPAVVTALADLLAALASTLTVAGTVSVANLPVTQTVDGTVDVGNHPAEFPLPAGQVATLTPQLGLTDAELRAANVGVSDRYTDGETLGDQSGTGEVLSFEFASQVDLVVIYPAEEGARADPFGGTPSATAGAVLLDAAPNFIPVTTTAVEVYVASGAVSVWGFRH